MEIKETFRSFIKQRYAVIITETISYLRSDRETLKDKFIVIASPYYQSCHL